MSKPRFHVCASILITIASTAAGFQFIGRATAGCQILLNIVMELEDAPFQFLREITDGFSENRILGEGAFGVVYKGVTEKR